MERVYPYLASGFKRDDNGNFSNFYVLVIGPGKAIHLTVSDILEHTFTPIR